MDKIDIGNTHITGNGIMADNITVSDTVTASDLKAGNIETASITINGEITLFDPANKDCKTVINAKGLTVYKWGEALHHFPGNN